MPKVGEIVLPQYNKKLKDWRIQRFQGRVFDIDGRLVELFPLIVLARSLGRTSLSVRTWERTKRFPTPMFVVPYTIGTCSRWYSKIQIANLRAVYLHYNNRHATDEMFREMWRVFYLTKLTPEAESGDVL